jgi:hypothetical protein
MSFCLSQMRKLSFFVTNSQNYKLSTLHSKKLPQVQDWNMNFDKNIFNLFKNMIKYSWFGHLSPNLSRSGSSQYFSSILASPENSVMHWIISSRCDSYQYRNFDILTIKKRTFGPKLTILRYTFSRKKFERFGRKRDLNKQY